MKGPGEMVQGLEYWALSQGTQLRFSVPTQWLITTYTSSPRGYKWLLLVFHWCQAGT